MALVSPSVTIVFVFLVTSWSLCLSVSKVLADAPQLAEWRQRLGEYATHPFNGTPDEQDALSKDLYLALSVVLRSELTVYLLVQWCLSAYAVVALLTVALFLGRLSSREMSRLSERLVKFIVFKVVFCGALIIPDIYEIVLWLGWFAMVGYMRIFMGAAKDRLESLVVSPRASTLSHLRTLALVLVILAHDVAGMAALLSSMGSMSTTKVLLCAFDMAIVLVEGMKTLLRYAVHLWDQRIASHHSADAPPAPPGSSSLGWESWEGKGAVLYHTELVADVLVHAMTLAHYLHVWFLHGLSFQLIDAILFLDIRSIILSMLKRIRGYLNYRHATHSLRHAFPDAQLGATHELCSICMERMSCAKQLPCQHHFHLACLRAWLQQSGTESFACPLCRTPLLRERAAAAAAQQQLRRQQQAERAAMQAAVRARGPLRRLWAGAARVVSALYLDLIIGLLLGLPSSTLALQRHALAAAAARREREAGASRSGRRPGGGRRGDDPPVERIGESDHPSPAAVAGRRTSVAGAGTAGAGARGRGLWGLLWWGRRPGAADAGAAGGGGGAAAALVSDGADDDTDVTGSDELDVYTSDEEDLHDIAAEDDSFQAPSQLLRLRGTAAAAAAAAAGAGRGMREYSAEPWSSAAPPVLGGRWTGRRRYHAREQETPGLGSGDEGGDGGMGGGPAHVGGFGARGAWEGAGEDAGVEGLAGGAARLPPSLPPPYPEPSTWSAGSLQAVGRQVAHTIRSSWGMGVHGPGAVAGHDDHGTDQEAESALRLRPRQRSRQALGAPQSDVRIRGTRQGGAVEEGGSGGGAAPWLTGASQRAEWVEEPSGLQRNQSGASSD